MQALVIIEAQGKVDTWSRVLGALGMPARVMATHGHVMRFPERLSPLGISFGPDGPCDHGRRLGGGFREALRAELRGLPAYAPVFIATDADSEGDVIALDTVEVLLELDAGLAGRIHRVLPTALTHDGIAAALQSAEPLGRVVREILERAVSGRARAVTDRWIGATFSAMADSPVGRVRSALLGAFFLLERAPQLLRGRPELGEITFRARSSSGGLPFLARLSVDGTTDPETLGRLKDLAARHAGGMVPGVVMPRRSLSAGVAPRIGMVRPFNTGDALAYAARHFNLGARVAMRGLQEAYMQGLISYPRTDSRDITRESAARVIRIGEALRLSGLDISALTDGPVFGVPARRERRRPMEAHEALHPVCDLDPESIARLERITRAPLRFGDHSGASAEAAMEIMASLVARRAFEASRIVSLEPGDWRPDNATAISPEDREALADLEWSRETLPALPWSKDLLTGSRQWPLRAIAVDLMMSEGIGRPSTWSGHAEIAETAGEILPGDLSRPPRPSPRGVSVLRKIPKGLWNPATCRMIEAALRNAGNVIPDGPEDTLDRRVRRRVMFWFDRLPEEMRDALRTALGDDGGGRRAGVAAAPDAGVPTASGRDLADLPAPTPFPT